MAMISVVIPVQNDSQRLAQCLQALQRQSYPNFEVIVVDNNSTEAIRPICQQFAARYCRETQLGNNAARNRGIAIAVGEVIAFTDSDCIPDPDWLAQGMAAMQYSPIVGGAIHLT
ncbi:glycosyltransferase family A protein [Rivularia sp. UHCC 0363]|uniref:glycosyltransferase family A protein n=1 Tax=Rivularia sp. UHCC 0363 TaxID=3110244 RepID=UPI002B20B470|nr:glycosyltransferase family A protein [Rivularia sp. UHCC 0363]MEA5597375.1 glycosyltransferase family A protein [Rivularia sp. UHCC 0363]